MSEALRVYEEAGRDGYPAEWHSEIKHLVRELAENRCVRCGHPYRRGEHGNGEWSACDGECSHGGPIRVGEKLIEEPNKKAGSYAKSYPGTVAARWRILTVHHLNGNKLDCRWWNLTSLCQRCHLQIQGRVHMEQVYPYPHTPWFRPYAAGYYAATYLGEDLTREETMERLDELLALECVS